MNRKDREELSAKLAACDAAFTRAEAEGTKAERDRDRFRLALEKVDAIRNSIVGLQSVNWSEHIYPLVAALNEAGFEGQPYEVARANVGTLIERAEAAEKDAAFHKMSALAFEDLHEAAEKRARDAEENAARWGHNIVVLQDALRDIEETTIAAVVALLRDMAFRWSEEGETKAEWIECTRANAEMLEHWRPKGREGGE